MNAGCVYRLCSLLWLDAKEGQHLCRDVLGHPGRCPCFCGQLSPASRAVMLKGAAEREIPMTVVGPSERPTAGPREHHR